MRRFANLKSYELIDVQNTIQDIYHLKKKDEDLCNNLPGDDRLSQLEGNICWSIFSLLIR